MPSLLRVSTVFCEYVIQINVFCLSQFKVIIIDTMGSLFSSPRYQQPIPENNQLINQVYNVQFGYAPIGPMGSVASVPKRNLYNSGSVHRHRRRY